MTEIMRFKKNHDQYNLQFSNNLYKLECNYNYPLNIFLFHPFQEH